MFREEQYININGKQISKNGFKNLNFETSRFSDSLTAIRGFGSSSNESNLSIIDTFNLDFIITCEELQSFAEMYAEFKVFGALPLENKYILDKIKSSLTSEKILTEVKETNKKQFDKEVSHMLVFLERLAVKSLNNTKNGYSITLTLTLFRHGFDIEEFQEFQKKYKQWHKEVSFSTIENKILSMMSDLKNKGDLSIKIANVDRLNYKFKTKMMDNIKKEFIADKDEILHKEKVKERTLHNSGIDVDSFHSIAIDSKHITQIELITHNIISNMPILSENIGLKAFLGKSKSNFGIKLILDESDKFLLSEIKKLSDKNLINHKMKIEFSFLNMFDFNNAQITNIFFNNSEQANAIVVTINFEVNGYDFFKEESFENSRSVKNYKSINFTPAEMFGGGYLEAIYNKLIFGSEKYETDLKELFSTILESKMINGIDEEASGKEKKESFYTRRYTFADALSAYSTVGAIPFFHKSKNNTILADSSDSVVSFFDLLENRNGKKAYSYTKAFRSSNNKRARVESLLSKLYQRDSRDEIIAVNRDYDYADNFFKVFDFFGLLKIYNGDLSSTLANEFNLEIKNSKVKMFENKVIEPILVESFNIKQNLISEEENELYKAIYREYLFNLPDIINTTIDPILKTLKINSVHLDRKQAKNTLDELVEVILNKFIFILSDSDFSLKLQKNLFYYYRNKHENDNNFSIKQYKEITETFLKKVKIKFENIKAVTGNEIKETLYNIALIKYIYPVAMSRITNTCESFEVTNGIKELHDSMLISSSLICPFFLCRDIMTAPIGLSVKLSTRSIGQKLGIAYSLFHSDKKETEDDDYKIKQEFFDNNLNTSYYVDKFNGLDFELLDDLSKTEVNKDYDFILGVKLQRKYPELFTKEILNNSKMKKEALSNVQNFINNSRKSFADNSKYCKTIEKEIHLDNFDARCSPDTFRQVISEDDENINNRMKKRIIGVEDPFTNLENIKNVLTKSIDNIIPDYDIFLGKTNYSHENAGVFNYIRLQEFSEFSNIISIRISKDNKTKIKSCIIQLLNNDRSIINIGEKGNSLSFKVNEDGKIVIFDIEAGDEIKVNLGNSKDKKRMFNGLINSIDSSGNIIELKCSSYATTLYSTAIDNISLKSSSFINVGKLLCSTTTEFFTTEGKEKIDSEKIKKYYDSYSKVNEHLYFKKEDIETTFFNHDGEESSMYSAFLATLSKMPESEKKYFMSKQQGIENSGQLISRKNIMQNIKTTTTNFSKNASFGSSVSNAILFKNIFNVDSDYETYGFKHIEIKNNKIENSIKEVITPIVPVIPVSKPIIQIKETESNNHIEPPKLEKEPQKKYKTTKITKLVENSDRYTKLKDVEFKHRRFDKRTGKSISTIQFYFPETDGKKYELMFPTYSRRIVSLYGNRQLSKKRPPGFHNGIDIGASKRGVTGDPIYVSADGIIKIKSHSKNAGYYLIVEHANNIKTKYLHLTGQGEYTRISQGDKVKQGQIIARMGNTGRSQAAHLHFEVVLNNKRGNPLDYLERFYITETIKKELVTIKPKIIKPIVSKITSSTIPNQIPKSKIIKPIISKQIPKAKEEVKITSTNSSKRYERFLTPGKSSFTSGHLLSTNKNNENYDTSLYREEKYGNKIIYNESVDMEFIEKKPGEIFNFYEKSILNSRWDIREDGDFASIILARDYYFYSKNDETKNKIRDIKKSKSTETKNVINKMIVNKNLFSLFGNSCETLVSLGFKELFDVATGTFYYKNNNNNKENTLEINDFLDRKYIRRFSEEHCAISGFNLIDYNITVDNNISNTISAIKTSSFLKKNYRNQISLSSSLHPKDIIEKQIDSSDKCYDFGVKPKSHHTNLARWNEMAANELIKETEYVNSGKIFISFDPNIEIGDSIKLIDSTSSTFGKFRIETFEHIFDRRGLITVLVVKAFATVGDPTLDLMATNIAYDLMKDFDKELIKNNENYIIKNIFSTFAKISSITPKYTNFQHKGRKNQVLEENGRIPTVVPYKLYPCIKKGKLQLSKSLQVFYSDSNSVYSSYFKRLGMKLKDKFYSSAISLSNVSSDMLSSVVDFAFSLTMLGVHEFFKPMLGITEKKAQRDVYGRQRDIGDEMLENLFSKSPYDPLIRDSGIKSIGFFNIQCRDLDDITGTKKGSFKNLEMKEQEELLIMKKEMLKQTINNFDLTLTVEGYNSWGHQSNKNLTIDSFIDSLGFLNKKTNLYKGVYTDKEGKATEVEEYGFLLKQKELSDDKIILNIKEEYIESNKRKVAIVELEPTYFGLKSENIDKLYVLWLHNLFGNDDMIYERKKIVDNVLFKATEISKNPRNAVIIMGDFNLQIINHGDKPINTSASQKNAYYEMKSNCEFTALIDEITTLDKNGFLRASSYDNILVSKNIKNISVAKVFKPSFNNFKNSYNLRNMSDHVPVFVYFKN